VTVDEALAQSLPVYVGVAVYVAKRFTADDEMTVVAARDKYFLVPKGGGLVERVDKSFLDRWTDWVPRDDEGAKREEKLLNGPDGIRIRNSFLWAVIGPIPKGLTAPDFLPEDIEVTNGRPFNGK